MTKTYTPPPGIPGAVSAWVSAASIGTDAETPTTDEKTTQEALAEIDFPMTEPKFKCDKCKDAAQFRIIPVGMRGSEERFFLACVECLGDVTYRAMFHSYIVRNIEWEEE